MGQRETRNGQMILGQRHQGRYDVKHSVFRNIRIDFRRLKTSFATERFDSGKTARAEKEILPTFEPGHQLPKRTFEDYESVMGHGFERKRHEVDSFTNGVPKNGLGKLQLFDRRFSTGPATQAKDVLRRFDAPITTFSQRESGDKRPYLDGPVLVRVIAKDGPIDLPCNHVSPIFPPPCLDVRPDEKSLVIVIGLQVLE